MRPTPKARTLAMEFMIGFREAMHCHDVCISEYTTVMELKIAAALRDAYNAGVEDAAKVVEESVSPVGGLTVSGTAAKIRALKEPT